MINLPRSVTNIGKVIDRSLVRHTNEMLAQTEHKSETSAIRLRMWKEKQDDKLNADIADHVKRSTLSKEDQALVDAWKQEK